MNKKTFYNETFINEYTHSSWVRLYGKFNTDKENTFCEYHVIVYDIASERTEQVFKDGEFIKAVQYAYEQIERFAKKYGR